MRLPRAPSFRPPTRNNVRAVRSLLSGAALLGTVILGVGSVRADQPIFNEMPRWDNGYGTQLLYNYRHDADLISGGTVVAKGFSEEVHTLHLESVYTWDKSIRATLKLPMVLDARREFPTLGGGKLVQTDSGIGDATVALPLKRYFNLDARSGSWTLAPQVRVPLASQDDYNVYDGVWGAGIGAGYETETYRFIFATSVSAWTFEGREPMRAAANIDLGLNFTLNGLYGHLVWETDFIYEDDGYESLQVGPKLYFKFTDQWHFMTMAKMEIHARRNALDHGNTTFVRIGIAFVN